MDIHLLGPIEAILDGRPLALGAPQQRAVLAMLALQVNRTVSADRLIEGIWGEWAPATAPKMVQLYVSQLRKLLRGDVGEIVTRGRGYEPRLHDDRVDVRRFERLVAEAGRADGAPNGQAREALGLWRGAPLSDVAHEPFAAPEIQRLEELRFQAAELAIDNDLALRRHPEILAEIRVLIAEAPLRERLRVQHMLALYRSGRQSEALEAYRDARTALVDAIGVEPGPELRRMHQAMLRQDPELEAPDEGGTSHLPPELDAGVPLIGRDAEMQKLREQWRKARAGVGRVVVIAGGRGLGKTRLAAELALEIARDGEAILYSRTSLTAFPAVREPTLLVIDDVETAPGETDLQALPLLILVLSNRVPPASGASASATIVLKPLGAESVRAVARGYAAAGAEVPVGRLLEASGGVPLHVHRVAARWARSLEARRLGETAERLAGERPALRAAEDDLIGDIIRLESVRERGDLAAHTDGTVCPFKGLASFEAEDAGFFYGREELVAEMVARLLGTPVLGLIGPSGSGKSSALRAGLLPAIASGVLPGSDRWTIALLRPGEHPLRELELALAGTPDGERLIVAVDQFEETFTACRDESERAAFVEALVASSRDPHRRTVIVIALRVDHYGRCAAYPELSRLLAAGHLLVGPMRSDEMRRAIELPAHRAGLRLDPGLADALVADLEGRPGALPLLSTSMLELWQSRGGRQLRLSAYQQTGGVGGSVARLAEIAYERLELAHREIARRTLLRLAGEGEGDAIVRRRVPLTELDGERDEDVFEVLRVLAHERLVTLGEGEVEVAHEALLREWPRLRGWLEDDAEGRRLHRHLTHAATDWESAGRDKGELYRGARLVSAIEWVDADRSVLNRHEHEFIAESRTQARLESERRRRANRRLRASLGAVAAMLVLAIIAGGVALSQRGAARDAAVAADAQRIGAEAVNLDRLDDALLLARAGVDLHDSAATRSNLLTVLQRGPATVGVLNADGSPLFAVAVSHDGRLVAVGSARGTVTIFNPATRRRVGKPYRLRDGRVQSLQFSPDGTVLAVAGAEPELRPPGGLVDLIDPRTGNRRRRIELPPLPRPARAAVLSLEFGPDGEELVVLQESDPPGADGSKSVLRKVAVATGEPRGRPLRVGGTSIAGVSASADRRLLFLTSRVDDETLELDVERFRVVRRFPVGDAVGRVGRVSADARRMALGSETGGVRLLDLRTGRVRRFSGAHNTSIHGMTFAEGGRTLVSSARDGTLLAWNVPSGEVREALPGHSSVVWGLEASPDGRSVYSAGYDGRALVWDVAQDRRLDRWFEIGPPFVPDDDDLPRGLALSPDGGTLAITQLDGSVDLVDARTLEPRDHFAALRGMAAGIAYSPDGRLLAVTGEDGEIELFDARTQRRMGELRGLKTLAQQIAISPDGRVLAAAELGAPLQSGSESEGAQVRFWNVRRRELTGAAFGTTSASIAFSPNGRLIAVGALDARRAEIRRVRDGRLVAGLAHADLVRSVAFSRDGTIVATGQLNGEARLWSTKTWKRFGPPLIGHDERLLDLDFSRDDAVLSTAGADGTIALWDVKTQRRLGSPITVEPDSFLSTAFTPDGTRLFAASAGRRALRLDVSIDAWKRHACRVAGRALTPAEWRQALPERRDQSVCARG